MCLLNERPEMCANHQKEKTIAWMMVLIAGIAGFVFSPRSNSNNGGGEVVAGVVSTSR